MWACTLRGPSSLGTGAEVFTMLTRSTWMPAFPPAPHLNNQTFFIFLSALTTLLSLVHLLPLGSEPHRHPRDLGSLSRWCVPRAQTVVTPCSSTLSETPPPQMTLFHGLKQRKFIFLYFWRPESEIKFQVVCERQNLDPCRGSGGRDAPGPCRLWAPGVLGRRCTAPASSAPCHLLLASHDSGHWIRAHPGHPG